MIEKWVRHNNKSKRYETIYGLAEIFEYTIL